MAASLSWRLFLQTVSLWAVALAAACGGKSLEAPPSPPPSAVEENAAALELARVEVEDLTDALRAAQEESESLRRKLDERNSAMLALEEQFASLELELGIALEELIRSQANLKNVQSRAFAVSRIAEVRVELQSFRGRKDPGLAGRLDRAESFLDRADRALTEDNVGGAAFLAERAGELVRQAKTIAEVQRREPRELVPIVPSRMIEVRSSANLRGGPGPDSERLSAVPVGTQLEALARLGEWYQVRSPQGETAWIHGSLVR